MPLNAISLGDFPIYDPPDDVVGVNRMCLRTGASKFGRGFFVMLRSDYDQLVTNSPNAVTTLKMDGFPGPGLSMSVVVAMAEPIVTQVNSDAAKGMVKVTVYDQRARLFTPIKKFYNVVQDGYPLDNSNKPICYQSTLKAATPPATGFVPWTWTNLLSDSSLLPSNLIPTDIPSWTPYNLIWDNIPLCRAFDDVAAQLFYVVGFDHQAELANALYLIPPYQSALGIEESDNKGFSSNQDLLDQTDQMGALVNGAPPGSPKATERNNGRLPGKLDVTFPSAGGGGDPYDSHRDYVNTVNTGFGASDYTATLNVGSMSAVWSGSAWLNQSDLDSVATDLAARASIWMSQVFGQAEYAGIWPFRPDGRIRQVEWISDKTGARTIISTDNAKDWSPDDSLDDPINLPVNQRDVGLGSATSAIGTNGINYASSFPPCGWFKIVSTATPGGLYTANPFNPPTTQPSHTATSLGYSDLGISANQTVYLENTREIGTVSNHIIDPTAGPPLLFWGGFKCVMDDGKPCYLFDGCQ